MPISSTTSIELRERIIGECDCGTPHNPFEHYPDHHHEIVCDWGVIEHSSPRPDRGEIGSLMLATDGYVDALLANGPVLTSWGARYSAEVRGGRTYVHVEFAGRRWCWELFATHGPAGWPGGILVGRWPD